MAHCQAVTLLPIANSGLVMSLLQQGSIIARSAFLAHAVPWAQYVNKNCPLPNDE